MKKIRCTDLYVGGVFGLAFYDSRSEIHVGKCVQKPTCAVQKMLDKDRYIVELENGEKVEFFRNNCEPHYLECWRAGKRGTPRRVRVIFYDIGRNVEAVTPTIAETETKLPEIEAVEPSDLETVSVVQESVEALPDAPMTEQADSGHPVIFLHGPEEQPEVDPAARMEGESFGAWMARRKKLKTQAA